MFAVYNPVKVWTCFLWLIYANQKTTFRGLPVIQAEETLSSYKIIGQNMYVCVGLIGSWCCKIYVCL